MEKNDFCVCSMIQSISLPLPPSSLLVDASSLQILSFSLRSPSPPQANFFFPLWLCEILSEWRYGYLLSSLSYDTTSFHSVKGGLDWCHCGSVCGSATSHCISHCCVHSCMWQKEQKICVDKNESIIYSVTVYYHTPHVVTTATVMRDGRCMWQYCELWWSSPSYCIYEWKISCQLKMKSLTLWVCRWLTWWFGFESATHPMHTL